MRMSASALWEIELKDGIPRFDRVYRAAKFLQLPIEEFYEEPGTSPSTLTVMELLGFPIIAEGASLKGDSLDYAYSGNLELERRKIATVLVHGDCLEPEVKEGDLLLVDIELSPRNGDIVIVYTDDKIQIKKFREATGKRWLESRYGKINFEDAQFQGVVIEKNVKMRG